MNPGLIVNADDYGHTPGVSKGIRESHLHGIVTSTTVMMNMPGVETALQQAVQECPRLELGVHLVLTTGVPLLPALQVRSLVGEDRNFPGESATIRQLTYIDLNEVRAEWGAQIDRFCSITGHPPGHLDSHHHISFLSPGLFQVMLELASVYGCAVRFPGGELIIEILSEYSLQQARECLRDDLGLLARYRPRRPDHFYHGFYGENASRTGLLEMLENLSAGVTEMMCHPGYVDDALEQNSDYCQERRHELSILTSHEVLAFVQARKIELIRFIDLSQTSEN